MWTIKTSSSSSYKIIIPKKEMKAKDFMAQIASLFKLKMGYFVVIYSLPLSPETEIEIDFNDNDGFESAYRFLPAFSKLKVELRTECSSSNGITIDRSRTTRPKEVVSEQLKREMGLHDDQGSRKRNYVTSNWSSKCDQIMENDPRFLLEFDKLRNGIEKVWGHKLFVLNPFQLLCPVCGEIRVNGQMNQPREILGHIRDCHGKSIAGETALKRLDLWKTNNFCTVEQLDDVAKIQPWYFKDPQILVQNPLVRTTVLTREINGGAA